MGYSNWDPLYKHPYASPFPRLDSGLGRGLAPRVRAHGTAAAEKNAAAQLRLRLDAGAFFGRGSGGERDQIQM